MVLAVFAAAWCPAWAVSGCMPIWSMSSMLGCSTMRSMLVSIVGMQHPSLGDEQPLDFQGIWLLDVRMIIHRYTVAERALTRQRF